MPRRVRPTTPHFSDGSAAPMVGACEDHAPWSTKALPPHRPDNDQADGRCDLAQGIDPARDGSTARAVQRGTASSDARTPGTVTCSGRSRRADTISIRWEPLGMTNRAGRKMLGSGKVDLLCRPKLGTGPTARGRREVRPARGGQRPDWTRSEKLTPRSPGPS